MEGKSSKLGLAPCSCYPGECCPFHCLKSCLEQLNGSHRSALWRGSGRNWHICWVLRCFQIIILRILFSSCNYSSSFFLKSRGRYLRISVHPEYGLSMILCLQMATAQCWMKKQTRIDLFLQNRFPIATYDCKCDQCLDRQLQMGFLAIPYRPHRTGFHRLLHQHIH